MPLFRNHQKGILSSHNTVPNRSTVSGTAGNQSNSDACNPQEKQQPRPVALRVAQTAAKVARILSIHKHKPSQPSPNANHLTESTLSLQLAAWPRSKTDSSASSARAAKSPKSSLLLAASAPTCVRTNQPHADITHKAASSQSVPERLIQAFPEITNELLQMHSFVCSLDHARVRWYGRIYICNSCVCFTGTGISLGSGGQRSNSQTKQQPSIPWFSNDSNSSLLHSSQLRQRKEWFASYQTIPQVRASTGSHRQSLYAAIGTPPAGKASTSPRQTRSNSAYSSTCGGISSRKPWRRMAIKVSLRDITRVNKELTLGFCPNAITVATPKRHYIFTNFVRRDRAFAIINNRWRQALNAQASLCLPAYDNPPAPKQTACKPEGPQHPLLVDTAQTGSTAANFVEPKLDLCQRSRKPHLVLLMREQCQKEPLDPIGLLSQLIGKISRNTMFVLVSVLVFCLLSLFL